MNFINDLVFILLSMSMSKTVFICNNPLKNFIQEDLSLNHF